MAPRGTRRDRWVRGGLPGLRRAGLALGDLGQVGEGEHDAAAVQMERDLLAVGASAQGALGDRGQPARPELLGCGGRSEDLRYFRCA